MTPLLPLRLARVACAHCGATEAPKDAAPWLCGQCRAWVAIAEARAAGDGAALHRAVARRNRLARRQRKAVQLLARPPQP